MFRIRKAKQTDNFEIFNVHKEAVSKICINDYSQEIIKKWINRLDPKNYSWVIDNHEFFIAEMDNKIIGFSQLDVNKNEVAAIYVHPNYIRNKVATKMFKEILDCAKSKYLKRLFVSSTITAEPFYQSCGFKKIANAKYRWENGTIIDSINMEMFL